jgi:tetratricopeptide (TPR) repeat protein
LFDVAPGPAHLVSLAIHLLNVACVGVLARLLLGTCMDGRRHLPLLAMLLFGFHPLLIEPVAWISGQFELVVTLFVLLGLLANLAIRRVVIRSVVVAACFLLAACAKESAVAFPLLLFVVDWLRPPQASRPPARASDRIKAQWPVYLAVLLAGLLYLLLRRWSIGYLVQSAPQMAIFSWQRLQLICHTFITYWHVIVWPMASLDPLHVVPYTQFGTTTPGSIATVAAAIALLGAGLWLLWLRNAFGGVIVGATAALLPMLHVLPIEFDDSFYHDRYAMTAIAIAAAFLPKAIADLLGAHPRLRRPLLLAAPVIALWLLLAVVNIRVTLPLWSNEIALWQWILREHPDSNEATNSLLSQYLIHDDAAHARPLAQTLRTSGTDCTTCMVNVANFDIMQGDAAAAAAALKRARTATRHWAPTKVQILGFIMTTGDLRTLQGDLAGAQEAYRDAMSMDPLAPGPRVSLAIALARQGQYDAARKTAEEAWPLFAPDDRIEQQQRFERAFARSRLEPASQP